MLRVQDLDPLAQCPKGKICDYAPILVNDEVQVERCTMCHRKVSYNKGPGGRIDNAKYQRVNIRSFIQPQGSMKGLFHALYGDEPIQRNKKFQMDKMKAKNAKESLGQEARSIARDLIRSGKY